MFSGVPMEQVITSKLKLFPNKEQIKLLEETTSIYISTINKIIENKTKNNVDLPYKLTLFNNIEK